MGRHRHPPKAAKAPLRKAIFVLCAGGSICSAARVPGTPPGDLGRLHPALPPWEKERAVASARAPAAKAPDSGRFLKNPPDWIISKMKCKVYKYYCNFYVLTYILNFCAPLIESRILFSWIFPAAAVLERRGTGSLRQVWRVESEE